MPRTPRQRSPMTPSSSAARPFRPDALSRRQLLQVGGLAGLGLTLQARRRPGAAGPVSGARARACILVFFYGGPSHLETWDPKPDAPAGIRGEWGAIETSATGVRIGEHLPLTAKVMHHL